MNHYKESKFKSGFVNFFKRFFSHIYRNYIPNNRDNFKQVAVKVLFLVALIGVIVSVSVISGHFLSAQKQKQIITESREIWSEQSPEETVDDYKTDAKKILYDMNNDFIAWVRLPGTQVDNPVYKADNDKFYLNHNQNKEKSRYGAVFAHCENVITEEKTDKNIVLFGHNMKDGMMFGELKKLRKLEFFKKHATIEFTTLYSQKQTYKIYAVFVLNSVRADDGGRIYNIYRQNFANKEDFDDWYNEALQRSFIHTGIDVNMDDEFLTLVTCANDFSDARLVVMARKVRENESQNVDTSLIKLNKNPRYPKAWYDDRGQKYPF